MPDTTYPPVGFHFSVRIDKGDQSIDSSWQEVSGLTAELKTEDLIEGGQNTFTYKLPVGTTYPNLVLKRGAAYVRTSTLLDWVNNAIANFQFELCNILVTLLDENSQPLMNWNFYNCYPVKWAFSDMKAMEGAVFIETIEFVHQGDYLFGEH